MGKNLMKTYSQRTPPSQRYAHLSGAIPAPRPSLADHSEMQVRTVLARLQQGPATGDALHDQGISTDRFADIVRLLKRRGAVIHRKMMYDPVRGHLNPSLFSMMRGPT